jgi:hypothetical protein
MGKQQPQERKRKYYERIFLMCEINLLTVLVDIINLNFFLSFFTILYPTTIEDNGMPEHVFRSDSLLAIGYTAEGGFFLELFFIVWIGEKVHE